MEKKISFNQFELAMIMAIRPLINEVFEGEKGMEFKINLGHFLIDRASMQRQDRNYSATDKHKGLIFNGFTEISASFYTLRDIGTLFRSFTSRPDSRRLTQHTP